MAVVIKNFASLLLVSATLSFSYSLLAAEFDQVSDAEAIAFQKKEVEQRLLDLNRRIDKCYEIRDATKIKVTPEEVGKRFQEAGLSRNQALYAIIHFGGQNEQRCLHKEATEFIYALNVLEKLNEETGLEIKIPIEEEEYTTSELRDIAITDRMQNYRIAILYSRLPSSIKAFLEESFGADPFRALAFADALPK